MDYSPSPKWIFLKIALIIICEAINPHFYAQTSADYFKIQIIDQETRRGVPLVELTTTNAISYYTDNNGIIAFYEPGLMNQIVHFSIKSHGYEFPKDFFDFRGVVLETIQGDSAIIEIKRVNIAERLYRITGQGQYHHSQLVGHPIPIAYPVMNGKVMGQDTFVETLYKGKIYWFWGDTNRPSYPLGNFHTSGATSELSENAGLDPSIGINLTYFVDSSGFSKQMCPIEGPGPVWIYWLANITNELGQERLVASYSRIKNLDEVYERGIAIFNDSLEIFQSVTRFDSLGTSLPDPKPYQKRSVESIVKMLKRQYSSLSVDRDETKAQNKLRTNQLTYVRNLLDSINNIPDVPPHLASKTIDVLKMWDGVLPLDLMQKLVWLSFFREELSYLRLSKWSDREEEMRELRNKLTEYIKLDIDQTLANHWNVEDYKDKFRDYFYNLYFHGSIYEKEIFDKYRHMMEK